MEDSPGREWQKDDTFNTPPANHLRMQGRELAVTDGLRLVAYDAAGEQIEERRAGIGAEYEDFFKTLQPSAIMAFLTPLSVGSHKDPNCDSIASFCRIVVKSRHLIPPSAPVFVLFNRGDERFLDNDLRREKLLGTAPMLLDTGALSEPGAKMSLPSYQHLRWTVASPPIL